MTAVPQDICSANRTQYAVDIVVKVWEGDGQRSTQRQRRWQSWTLGGERVRGVDKGIDLAAMSCWHTLMGKGYNLLAGSSGSVPGAGCTSANCSWTARFTTSNNADAEHEEMVNEFQAMVQIGKRWANAPDDPLTEEDDPIPSNFDPETATIKRTENEDKDSWNDMHQSTVDDVHESDPAPEKIETFEDDSKNLYPTIITSTGVVQSSLDTVNFTSVVEHASPTCYRYKLLPPPVYEDACAWPPRDASPSLSSTSLTRTGRHQLQMHPNAIEIQDDAEEPSVVQVQGTTHSAGYCDDDVADIRHTQREGDDKEVKELDAVAVERRFDDNDSFNPQPRVRASSSLQHGELSDATPRRSSQLSETLKNNLERLLQRGPVSVAATMTNSGRRRTTNRDDGLTTSSKRQATSSGGHKQQHRRHHNHHHHHLHRHHHHRQQQDEEELKFYSIQDDEQSLMTDTGTVRSLSATSVSGISSISDGIRILLISLALTLQYFNSNKYKLLLH